MSHDCVSWPQNRTIEKAKERKFWRLPKKGSSPKLEHQRYNSIETTVTVLTKNPIHKT